MPKRYRRHGRAFATIQDWMDATGASQGDTAKLLQISQSHLSNIMSKRQKPSLGLALHISRTLNVPIESLVQTERIA